MAYVAAKCPNCGGSIQIDVELDRGYCSYCGSLINFKEAVEILNIVHEVGSSEENFIKLIHREITSGKNHLPEFRTLLYRAVEQNPNNKYFKNLYACEIWKAKVVDGVLVRYPTAQKRITLPNCITKIKSQAFDNAMKIIYITIPKSVIEIEDGAFKFNKVLIIGSYINSYATKFALTSNADLNLLDGSEYEKEKVKELKAEHRETVNHINAVHKKIRRTIAKRRNYFFYHIVFSACLIAWINLFIAIFNSPEDETFKLILCLLAVFVVFIINLLINKHKERQCNLALMEQINDFNTLCNGQLRPLGMVNSKYVAGSAYTEDTDFDEELRRVVAAKERIKEIKLYQFLK